MNHFIDHISSDVKVDDGLLNAMLFSTHINIVFCEVDNFFDKAMVNRPETRKIHHVILFVGLPFLTQSFYLILYLINSNSAHKSTFVLKFGFVYGNTLIPYVFYTGCGINTCQHQSSYRMSRREFGGSFQVSGTRYSVEGVCYDPLFGGGVGGGLSRSKLRKEK